MLYSNKSSMAYYDLADNAYDIVNNANEIIPRIWVGDINSALDSDFLKKERITTIFNCTTDFPINDELRGIVTYRIAIKDNLKEEEFEKLFSIMRITLNTCYKHYKKGERILIHCAAGMQRSAMVCLCFLCDKLNYHPKSAYLLMKKKRPIVFTPYMNFIKTFRMYFGDNMYEQLVKQN